MFGGIIPLVNGNRLNVIVLHLQIISSKWQLVAVADCRAEIWPSTLIAKLTGEFQPIRLHHFCLCFDCAGYIKRLKNSKAWPRSQPGIHLVFLYKFSFCFGAKLRPAQETEICTAVHKNFREEGAHESQAWPAVNLASATLKVTILFTSELLSSGNAIFGSLIGSASYAFFLFNVSKCFSLIFIFGI